MLVIDEKKCVGCALCNAFCPFDALEAWGINRVDPDKCTDCAECIAYCPVDALEVKE
ncbi:MAG: 4Fe-4S binding protein [Chloroflexi bacterium]|nr:4Fe-4S binding protein [Chloroflexota bacterium]